VKAQEIRRLKDEEILEQLEEHYKELFNLRFQKVAGRLSNTSRPRQVRREIARMKTVLRERELEQADEEVEQEEA
jgi:large subunit ribosomal protein L29